MSIKIINAALSGEELIHSISDIEKLYEASPPIPVKVPLGIMATEEIFVDDQRAENDPSLAPVPRIETYEELQSVFKLDIRTDLGGDSVSPGEKYWKVVGFYLRTGAAAFIPKVRKADGSPFDSVVVFANWPGAPDFGSPIAPPYFSNGVGGFTNENGDIGFGYSGGAVLGENGGVYSIWCSSDPVRLASDCGIQLGWHGATDHLTPNPIIQEFAKSGTTPPIGGAAKMIIKNADGSIYGHIPIQDGAGPEGIKKQVLEIGGVEMGYIPIIES